MIDLETTGLGPDENAILQLAGVRFNLQTRAVDVAGIFVRSIAIPPKRFWDLGTLDWWNQQDEGVYAEVTKNPKPAEEVMKDFHQWANEYQLRFWSKPSHFDFQFVQSYCRQFGYGMPFNHSQARDMRSFIAGLYHPHSTPNLEVPFHGNAHNAIWDALHQIQTLYAHLDNVAMDKAPVAA